ncbi:MAG: hypothetical protein AB8I08_05670 [Sandaracinaceae bacterium]
MTPRNSATPIVFAFAVLLGGCFASHGLSSGEPLDPDAGIRCGTGAPCASDEQCCGEGADAVCQPFGSVCEPDEPPVGVRCGRGGRCEPGETCCPSPIDADTCVPAGVLCPGIGPPPGSCFGEGECGAGFICQRSVCSENGECRPIDPDCPAACPGVCACDDRTYCNGCEAQNAGADDWTDGPCSDDPELGICQRVCARAQPVCGISIATCEGVCATELSTCSAAEQAEVERCSGFKDCGVVIDCLSEVPCIDVI